MVFLFGKAFDYYDNIPNLELYKIEKEFGIPFLVIKNTTSKPIFVSSAEFKLKKKVKSNEKNKVYPKLVDIDIIVFDGIPLKTKLKIVIPPQEPTGIVVCFHGIELKGMEITGDLIINYENKTLLIQNLIIDVP